MKIQELIERIDMRDPIYLDSSLFDNEPGFMFGGTVWFEIPADRLIGYSVYDWYDGDTVVGPRIFFFDGEFVFYTETDGRKCDPTFYWQSYEAHEKVKNYIMSLVPKEEVVINLLEQEAEIAPEEYTEEYAECVIHGSTGYLDGRKVTVNRLSPAYCMANNIEWDVRAHYCDVTFEDGKTERIHISRLRFRPKVKPKMLKDLSRDDKEMLAYMVDSLYEDRVNLNTAAPPEQSRNRLHYWCAQHNISFDAAEEYLHLAGWVECCRCGRWQVTNGCSHLSEGEVCHFCT